jgi:hypothetical protein
VPETLTEDNDTVRARRDVIFRRQQPSEHRLTALIILIKGKPIRIPNPKTHAISPQSPGRDFCDHRERSLTTEFQTHVNQWLEGHQWPDHRTPEALSAFRLDLFQVRLGQAM